MCKFVFQLNIIQNFRSLLKCTLLVNALLLLASCNPDEDGISGKFLTIDVATDFFQTDSLNAIYICNADGKIVHEELLHNDKVSEITLENNDNILSKNHVAFVYGKIISSGKKVNDIFIFNNLDPTSILLAEQNKTAKEIISKKISITDAGGYLELANSHYTALSSKYLTLINASNHISDDLYLSFILDGKKPEKYLLVRDFIAEPQSSFNYIHLPKFDREHTIAYPENENLSYILAGKNPSNLDDYLPIGISPLNKDIPSTFTSYYPSVLFNQFQLISFIEINNRGFLTVQYSENAPPVYKLPNLDYDVVSNAYNNLAIVTKSKYDYYELNFTLSSASSTNNITILGKKEGETITINTALINELTSVLNPENSFNDPSQLKLLMIGMEGSNSYDQIIKSVLISNYELEEVITKLEEVKETINLN
jgi:hypothetical protein